MPAFIHDRAQHILAKNPKMDKSQAFAIATQQSHALGKSPKGYGTSKGKSKAKKKYDKPKQYKKGANPGNLKTPKLESRKKEAELIFDAFRDELEYLSKEGGLKELLLTEIPGTKPWIIGNVQKATRGMGEAPKKVLKLKQRGGGGGATRGGVYDLSRQAAEMGL